MEFGYFFPLINTEDFGNSWNFVDSCLFYAFWRNCWDVSQSYEGILETLVNPLPEWYEAAKKIECPASCNQTKTG